MKKKLLVVFAVLFIGTAADLSALGIGIQFNSNALDLFGYYPSITFKLNDSPFVFAANGYILTNQLGFGLTADMWVLEKEITGSLNWFLGWGLYGNIWLGNTLWLGAGGRIPVGLSLRPVDFLELYLQVAGQIGVQTHGSFISWGVPVGLGIRFWF